MLICMFGLELIYFIGAGNIIGAGNNFGSGSRFGSKSTVTVYNNNVSLYELTLHYKLIMSTHLIFNEVILFLKSFPIITRAFRDKENV